MNPGQSSFKKNQNLVKKEEPKIFFGHPELDGLLSNNLKKGTLILIEEDHPTSLHVQLERYYIGCGYHQNQKSFIYDVFDQKWKSIIPQLFNSERSKKQEEEKKNEQNQKQEINNSKEGQQQQQQNKNTIEDNQQGQNAQIAWRYDRQNIKLKDIENFVSKDIPKLDLSKSEKTENVEGKVFTQSINEFKSYKEIFEDICQKFNNSLSDEKDTGLRKILITNLFSSFSKIENNQQELIKFIYSLKVVVRASHCLLLLTIPTSLKEDLKQILFLNFDLILKIDPLFQSEDFDQFHGILHFLKLPQLNNFQNFKLDTLTWGIKANSKRKLEIDRLYLSPEKSQTSSSTNQNNSSQQNQNNNDEQQNVSSNKQAKMQQIDF